MVQGFEDSDFLQIIDAMEHGLLGSSLGGCLYKKRLGIDGRGKSNGTRTIIAYRAKDKAIFLAGYAKNEKVGLTENEEVGLKMAAKEWLNYDDSTIKMALTSGLLFEIKNDSLHSKQILEDRLNG